MGHGQACCKNVVVTEESWLGETGRAEILCTVSRVKERLAWMVVGISREGCI